MTWGDYLSLVLFGLFGWKEGPGLKPNGEPQTLSAWVRKTMREKPAVAIPAFLVIMLTWLIGGLWFVWHIFLGGPK
jgi:hypothetical protein